MKSLTLDPFSLTHLVNITIAVKARMKCTNQSGPLVLKYPSARRTHFTPNLELPASIFPDRKRAHCAKLVSGHKSIFTHQPSMGQLFTETVSTIRIIKDPSSAAN